MSCRKKCLEPIASENGVRKLAIRSCIGKGLLIFSNRNNNFAVSDSFSVAVPSLCLRRKGEKKCLMYILYHLLFCLFLLLLL